MIKIPVVMVLIVAGVWLSASFPAKLEAAHAMAGMDSAEKPGKQIRKTSLNGYTLTYHLLDSSERREMIKHMGHHSVIGMSKNDGVTNHLMLYIQKPDGTIVTADVAFYLTGPDGKSVRTMTMGMNGGYGADTVMNLSGLYTIRTRIVLENANNLESEDHFTFTVK